MLCCTIISAITASTVAFPTRHMDLVSDMTQVSIKGSTSSKTNAERRETEERYRYKMFKHVEGNVQV